MLRSIAALQRVGLRILQKREMSDSIFQKGLEFG